jgi:hypothetical protein
MNIATEIVDTSIGSIWLARRADADNDPFGIGDTESDAIADLLTLIEETDE